MFNQEQERELVDFVLLMESRLFGLTLTELRSLAYELAERNKLKHNFSSAKKMAGKDWLYSFLRRNPELKLRSPEPTSLARAIGFNRTVVKQFFDLLSDLYDRYKFSPDRIYNVDETGIRTVPSKQSKVLSMRGKRQVGCLTSGERGQLVTAETCMSASGSYMPTMFVFPRQRAKPELLDDAPPGTSAEYHSSGWMQKDIFVKWFERFISFSKPTKEKPVLLLLDGHATHTKSLELINMARENNVILLCFPQHCTHRMQPLDVSFMAPLSQYYSEEVRKWLQSHPGRVVTINQIGKLYGAAFMRAASVEMAVNGFRKTGIFPLDSNVFPDWMFEPAETTDRSLETVNVEMDIQSVEKEISQQNQNTTIAGPSNVPLLVSQDLEAVKDHAKPDDLQDTVGCTDPEPGPSTSTARFQISPKDIRPLPRAQRREEGTQNRRRGKTAVLTSSPYKQELEALLKKAPKTAKRKLALNAGKTKKIRSNKTRRNEEDTESSEDEDNAPCIFCKELFSNSKSAEGWIKCIKCNGWAHEECAGVDDDDDDGMYKCDFC